MRVRQFLLWLAARLLFVLGTTFSMLVLTMVGVAKHDTTLASQLLWIAGLSVVLYAGGVACWLTTAVK